MLNENAKDCEITKASIPDLRKIKDQDFGSQRVFKKTSPNSVLTLYLGTRDVICRQGIVEPLRGVIYIDPKFTPSHKIYGQLTLTFRYGREDEEVMGLKFCNEAIIALKQIWPTTKEKEELSPLQQALIDRLGKNAYPFSLDVGTLAPPSVQLIPAKRYNGAPIGTSYDIRVHMADQEEERLHRRCMVRLGVRVIHKVTSEAKLTQLPINTNPSIQLPKTLRLRLSPKALKLANKFTSNAQSSNSDDNDRQQQENQRQTNGGAMSRIDIERIGGGESKGPEGSVDKPFLWTEGRVSLRAALNKSAYGHGEHLSVTIDVRNDSRKVIRKIRIFAVQHVDVCMFSNGKFKNVVADINENHQIKPGETHRKSYSLLPIRGPTKNWIAVEGTPSNSGGTDTNMANYSYKIASSAPRGPQTVEERNVFAIYVSYYIKVKLALSGMGGEVALKLPFILGHVDDGCNNSSPEATTSETTFKNYKSDLSSSKIVVEEDSDGNEEELGALSLQTFTNKNDNAQLERYDNNGPIAEEDDNKIIEIVDSTVQLRKPDNSIDSTKTTDGDINNCVNSNNRNVNVVTAQIHTAI